jgi:hypothetical protein
MELRWPCAAVAATILLIAAGPAGAQQSRRPAIAPPSIAQAAALDADADADARLLAAPAVTPRSRMIHVQTLADNIEFGIGRYAVPEIARPRTHMEADRYPTDVRRRGRGIAGVGLKLSF